MKLEDLIAAKKIRIEHKPGKFNPDWKDCTPYSVKLIFGRRSYSCPFYMGRALEREPTATDVLSCLISDAMSFEYARSFGDWCRDMGYDYDSRSASRKAEKIYKACEKTLDKLRAFLGDDFDAFVRTEQP